MSLNFPPYPIQTKEEIGKKYIWCLIRKKYLVFTPEEWVRQHVVYFLIEERHFSKSLIAVEKGLLLNGLKKRFDIVAFNRKGQAVFIVECKAPKVKITQNAFEQVARYNMVLKVNYLLVTNGLQHYCCVVNHLKEDYVYLPDIPFFEEI